MNKEERKAKVFKAIFSAKYPSAVDMKDFFDDLMIAAGVLNEHELQDMVKQRRRSEWEKNNEQ